jgi:uncharacterized protein (DUF2147 family)
MKTNLLSILLLTTFTLPGFTQSKDDVLGKWFSSSGGAQIQIYKKAGKYFGKIIWLRKPNDEKGKPKRDIRNPDPALRSRPAIGLEVLKNFTFQNGIWDGTIYDPKSGRTYSCKMTMNDHNKLDIRGYVGFSMLGRTESWTRAH